MPLPKAKLPTPGDQCAERLKVLADQTRLAVVAQLMQGAKHVAEINAQLNVEQSLLSHHLKVLRQAGLVRAQRDGKAVLYSLAPELTRAGSGRAIDLGCCQLSFAQVASKRGGEGP